MNEFSLRRTFVALALLASAALAQQAPENTPAADAPKAQQKPEKAKKPAPKKIYTNADLASSDANPEADKAGTKDGPANPVAGGDSVKANNSSTPAAQTSNSSQKANPSASTPSRSGVFDRPQQTSPDVIVVPAGRQIKVDISEENPPRDVPLRMFSGKVTVPVRVGWATAIPALTKVTVEVSALYYPVPGRSVDYQGVAQLTAVMLDGTRYDLHTDQVPMLAGSASELTFTLLKDVTLKH
jgi:hypothetical protein